MSDYDNKNSGVLFKNDRKETERHPDYRGTFTDSNGVEHWLSAWIKTSAKGDKFMSLSASPKDPQQAPVAQSAPQPAPMDFDSDVPFSNYEYKTLV
jgi:uncharacterized protein (DUF736 family)